jgi:hypothetical protein
MQSFNGPDTATLRYQNLDPNGVKLFVEEERSANGEMTHTNERLGYMALWDGAFTGPTPSVGPTLATEGAVEFGDIVLDHTLQTVSLT